MLEFCVCLILVITLAFGAISLSMSMRERSVLLEASRIGARSAAFVREFSTPTEVSRAGIKMAQNYLTLSGYSPEDYEIQVVPEVAHFNSPDADTPSGEVSIIRFRISGKGIFRGFSEALRFNGRLETVFPVPLEAASMDSDDAAMQF